MKLKELRKENKKTQETLSTFLKVAESTYRGYENGTSEPTIETLCKLADYYNVSLDYLCGRTWNNQIGYVPENKKDVIQIILQLNDINTVKALSYCSGLLAAQN